MPNEAEKIYTVSQLNAEARFLLEQKFQTVSLIGEISNLARPSSGHAYFSLKDTDAQVRCAMFRHSQRGLTFKPENGQQVIVQAKVSLYEARGDYQLIVSQLQLAGEGALQIAFEKLKKKLADEGLFDETSKQEIPALPKTIGVITSATGAALRDILRVLQRRFPALLVIIYPSAVQGQQAKGHLVSAIKTANERKECDVLILARGGGSLEDLWPFNEETVARAIYHSEIPIVTGIGHEVDFTIADFVADQRCATPSAAAEWVSPDKAQWIKTLNNQLEGLVQLIKTQLKQSKLVLDHLKKRLQHPGQRLEQQAQTLDQLEQRLFQAIQNDVLRRKEHLTLISRNLNTVSPLNTLKRGYAILSKKTTIITDSDQVKKGDHISAKLSTGELNCIIE